MWLLNIERQILERFEGSNVPKYAILSHRWESDEVSFQDVFTGIAERRMGHSKIYNFCQQIIQESIPVTHIWIDTCCIDKSNHSELSEAINSMFKWYMKATICFAYLSDISVTDMSGFINSKWFTRGWTLQELLAPDEVHFYDQDWQKIGTKLDLSDQIKLATGIPSDALKHFDSRRTPHSVADRMSWAARRQTTREEDLAYCLLGIFGVNMPLLYGEGARSFLRLQEEILKISEDLSIFAWQKFPNFPPTMDYLRDTSFHDFGLFAPSPESYTHRDYGFRNLLENSSLNESNYLESFFSGAGLALNLMLVPHCPDIYIAPLCEVIDTSNYKMVWTGKIVAMFLERTNFKGRYRRIAYDGQTLIVGRPSELNLALGRTLRVILERTPYHAMGRESWDRYGFDILKIENDILRLFQMSSQDNVEILKRNPNHKSLFMRSGEVGVAGIIRLTRRKLQPIYFHFGFDFDFNPFCLISRPLYQSLNSQEDKILFESSTTHTFSVDCSISILQLVSLMQADSRKFNLQQHNMELHIGSWQSNEMQFVGRDCRIGLDISASDTRRYVYHVYIGLAHKSYPWAPDPDAKRWSLDLSQTRFKWHIQPWDKDLSK